MYKSLYRIKIHSQKMAAYYSAIFYQDQSGDKIASVVS